MFQPTLVHMSKHAVDYLWQLLKLDRMQQEAAIREPLILGEKTYGQITDDVMAPVVGKANRSWWIVFGISAVISSEPNFVSLAIQTIS